MGLMMGHLSIMSPGGHYYFILIVLMFYPRIAGPILQYLSYKVYYDVRSTSFCTMTTLYSSISEVKLVQIYV